MRANERRFCGKFLATFCAVLIGGGVVGCERAIPVEEFGTPVYKESELPGAGEPAPVIERESAVDDRDK